MTEAQLMFSSTVLYMLIYFSVPFLLRALALSADPVSASASDNEPPDPLVESTCICFIRI
jgi:hypothetical protein